MLFSRDNRWFAPWVVLMIVWALASPAAFASAAGCACCGPQEAPADDCCAGEEPGSDCDDAIGGCCLMASLSDASRYAIDRGAAPGVSGAPIASLFVIAPPPRPGALAWCAFAAMRQSPPAFLLHSVFLA